MNFKQLVKENNYQTDKCSEHSYLNVYSELFDPIKETVLNVLEVGVYKGHSLLLWRDFFVNANVFGVDISNENLIIDLSTENRINFYHENAYSNNFLNKFDDVKFDIIIDDGNHLKKNIIWFVKNYPKILKENGILIVEDLRGFNYAEIIKRFLPKHLQSKSKVIDLRNISNVKNDILLIVK